MGKYQDGPNVRVVNDTNNVMTDSVREHLPKTVCVVCGNNCYKFLLLKNIVEKVLRSLLKTVIEKVVSMSHIESLKNDQIEICIMWSSLIVNMSSCAF